MTNLFLELSKAGQKFDELIGRKIPNTYEWITKKTIEEEINKNKSRFSRYVVEEKDGNKVLKIAKGQRGLGMQIVPIEDYFAVLYFTHLFTGHGVIKSMKNHLASKNLYVPLRAMVCFLKLCGPCAGVKSNRFGNGLTYQGFVELIDMSRYPDGEAKYVLHFKALKLKRSYLRALRSSDAIAIAEELLKIYETIGPPVKLLSPTISFSKALIQRMAIMCPRYKIICGREMLLERKSTQVKNNIKQWMVYYKSTEWSKTIQNLNTLKKYQHLKKTEKKDEKLFKEMGSLGQNILSKKEEHEIYCQNNVDVEIVPVETSKYLKTNLKTYRNKKLDKQTMSFTEVENQKKDLSMNNNKTSQIINSSSENKVDAADTNIRNEVSQLSFSQGTGKTCLETLNNFSADKNKIYDNGNDEEDNKNDTKCLIVIDENNSFDQILDLKTYENKYLKEEPLGVASNSNDVDMDDEEYQSFGKIVKVESLI